MARLGSYSVLFLAMAGFSACDTPTPSPAPSVPATDESTQVASQPPNVIIIFSDDHGYADLGIQSDDPAVRTPHTDRLALDGVLFRQGYVTAPQCSPSRAGLLTGVYQGRFGYETNHDGPLEPRLKTIAERLQAAGYRTGMAGKWHLGLDQNTRGNVPEGSLDTSYSASAQGFAEYFEGTRDQFLASHDAHGVPVEGAPAILNDSSYRIDLATQWALNFIDRSVGGPFLLYLPYFAPHVPLEAPAEDRAAVAQVADETRRTALAMIYSMDRGVGAIRARLAEHGLTENTLIAFIGDNGAPLQAHVRNGSSNGALRGEKGMLTEGGLRVPFVVSWPARLPIGKVFPHPVSSLDIAATIMAATGSSVTHELEGVDLVSVVSDELHAPARPALYWRWMSQAAIRTPDWKLIYLGDGRRYLFDMRTDDRELNDFSAAFPERVEELSAALEDWAGGLQPPGLPQAGLSGMENRFYTAHGFAAR